MYNAIDSKLYQISIFCDLSKAFDTLFHCIMLKSYGIHGPAHEWFKGYLSHRKQFTVYKSFSSLQIFVMFCPNLFLMHVNDIIHCSDKFNFLLYADDTTIYIHGKDFNLKQNILNRELTRISNWINSNKLKLNIMKT